MSRSLPMISEDKLVRCATRDCPTLDDAVDDGGPGLGALKTERGCLPLESLDVRGRVDGLLARSTVRQTFVNRFDVPLEATYIFPLPDRAAVTRFRMWIGERLIEGVLEERGRAREQYEQAIVEGRRAAIAEEERPGVFTLRVGNLMPGERARVELTLCGVLPYADGEATFRFPLVVAPRYVPGAPLPGPSVGDGTAVDTVDTPDASRISPPVLLPGFPNPVRLSLEVELHGGGADMEDLQCSLHAVEETPRDGYRLVRLHPGERLNRDFLLRFRLGGPAVRSTATFCPDADNEHEGTFALTIVPPAHDENATNRPRDIVFVLDRSGSMGGWKMVAARRAVARMIDTLNDADRFCLLAFDNQVETPPGQTSGLTAATDRHRFGAVEFLAQLDARGGTEMAGPVQRAVKLLSENENDDRDRTMVLITDGQVGNEDQVLRTLGKRSKRVRVFTLGIDRAVNAGFLRRLAEWGGGTCELVETEDRLDDVMAALHRRIGTPLLTGLGLASTDLAIEPGEIVPRRLPDLFAGSPLLILGRYRGRADAVAALAVRATNATGRAWSDSVPIQVRDNPAVAAAWARGQVRQLEDRYVVGDGPTDAIEKAIIAISIKFQVLCRFTAYVAIDRSEVANTEGEAHRVVQPVEQPEGWRDGMVRIAMSPPALPRRMRAGLFPPSSSQPVPPPPPPSCRADLSMEAESVDSMMQEFSVLDADPDGDFHPSPPPSAHDGNSEPALAVMLALAPGQPMKPRSAAELIAKFAEALRTLHDHGTVHGNINPSTVHVPLHGAPWFEGIDAGPTPLSSGEHQCYAAPERFEDAGAARDPRWDVYSLGAMLYLLLTGQRPPLQGPLGNGPDEKGPIPALVRPRTIVRSVPVELEAICLKAMAVNPADRYQTVNAFASALRDYLRPKRRKGFWK